MGAVVVEASLSNRFDGTVPVEPAPHGFFGPGDALLYSASSSAAESVGGVTVCALGAQLLANTPSLPQHVAPPFPYVSQPGNGTVPEL